MARQIQQPLRLMESPRRQSRLLAYTHLSLRLMRPHWAQHPNISRMSHLVAWDSKHVMLAGWLLQHQSLPPLAVREHLYGCSLAPHIVAGSSLKARAPGMLRASSTCSAWSPSIRWAGSIDGSFVCRIRFQPLLIVLEGAKASVPSELYLAIGDRRPRSPLISRILRLLVACKPGSRGVGFIRRIPRQRIRR